MSDRAETSVVAVLAVFCAESVGRSAEQLNHAISGGDAMPYLSWMSSDSLVVRSMCDTENAGRSMAEESSPTTEAM